MNIYDTLDRIEQCDVSQDDIEYVRHYIQGQKDIITAYSKMLTEKDNTILLLRKQPKGVSYE